MIQPTKSKIIFAIGILTAGILLYCFMLSDKDVDRKVNIDKNLNSIKVNQFFSFSQLNPDNDWNCAFIIGPYNTDGIRKIKMSPQVRSEIESKAIADEGYCTIIFEKEGKLVSYACVSRNRMDFSELDNIVILRTEKLYWTMDRKVMKVKCSDA